MPELSHICVMVERKYVFPLLRAENERLLAAFVAGKK